MIAKAEIQPQTGGPLEKADQPDSSSTEGPLSGDNTDTKRGKDAVFIEPIRTVTGVNVPVFEAGSALCSAAPNMTRLIVGLALCGLDGVESWAFYINLTIGGLAVPVYLFMLPSPDPQPGATILQRLVEIGWIGAPLMLSSIVCFTMGISFGGVRYEWDSGSEIALFVVAGVLFIIFGVQQAYCIGTTKERRIFLVELIASRTGFSIAQASVPAPKAAVASFLIPLAQTNGINIALAVSNAVFLNRAEKRLTAILPDTVTEAQIQAAIAGVGTDFVTTLSPRMQQEVLEAIVEALNLPYILVNTAGALVLACSVLMKRERLLMPADVGV
ncbi:hypothetical protein CPAR01_09394 [Colletotrichum paranaense]|uniref:Major facilitator superfamily transporter n=1 Tax=Colletotrichum paranaense TaxID=1914294 RepID=A0ABQ9SGL8_9PEZI|nr:uncharacterized protein CPAR01_09394 [Colletotrichum paranaense]KAK1535852.1 hypothetical protein CPAR01_09394 [Colletotrichum paranaense]